MAAWAGAGQYEDAFSPHRLQNWSVPRPRPRRQHPSPQERSTQIIADDRGHLLPAVPRSQASPWGKFLGTWEMPPRIPPARLDLTSRSAAAAARLTDWIRQPTALTRACNGLRTEITGKPPQPRTAAPTPEEPSRRSGRASGDGTQPATLSPGAALEEPPSPAARAPAAEPLSQELSFTAIPWKAAASPEPPAGRQLCSRQAERGAQTPRPHRPAVTELRRGDAGSPQIPASLHPAPREAGPRPATPPRGSAPSRGGSAEAEPWRGRSPGLQARLCVGRGEVGPGGSAAGSRLAPSSELASLSSLSLPGSSRPLLQTPHPLGHADRQKPPSYPEGDEGATRKRE